MLFFLGVLRLFVSTGRDIRNTRFLFPRERKGVCGPISKRSTRDVTALSKEEDQSTQNRDTALLPVSKDGKRDDVFFAKKTKKKKKEKDATTG